MELSEIFVILMFLTFGGLLLTGFPVAWVLAGTAVIWTFIGIAAVEWFDADLWFEPRFPTGSQFQFTLPNAPEAASPASDELPDGNVTPFRRTG